MKQNQHHIGGKAVGELSNLEAAAPATVNWFYKQLFPIFIYAIKIGNSQGHDELFDVIFFFEVARAIRDNVRDWGRSPGEIPLFYFKVDFSQRIL